MKALLIGKEPGWDLGYVYVDKDYDAVVIGSLGLGEALCFQNEQVLAALAEGMAVLCYEPGFPSAPKNRALGAALASAKRQMKSWGIRFASGAQKKLITAGDAKALLEKGTAPPPGAVLTPLAKEILEG